MIEFSFIVPLYNEEKNIAATLETLLSVGEQELKHFEIIIVNDASTDQSKKILVEQFSNISEIVVLENEKNQGFANSFKRGVKQSKGRFAQYIPSDNAISKEALALLLRAREKDKVVLQYCINPYERPPIKAAISVFYSRALNLLNMKRVKYYNGLHIFPGTFLRKVELQEDSFAFQAELVLKALKELEFKQVGINCTYTDEGSSALNKKNVKKVLIFVLKQIYQRQ